MNMCLMQGEVMGPGLLDGLALQNYPRNRFGSRPGHIKSRKVGRQ
jgi:hypothetical protein